VQFSFAALKDMYESMTTFLLQICMILLITHLKSCCIDSFCILVSEIWIFSEESRFLLSNRLISLNVWPPGKFRFPARGHQKIKPLVRYIFHSRQG